MKKKSKIITALATAGLCIGGAFLLGGCNFNNDNISDKEARIKEVYALALESGFEGTYEEWLESIKGENGLDGREVEFNVSDTHIQWRYRGEVNWTNLISLSDLNGSQGETEKSKSTYELYCEHKVNYRKSEVEWINDLISGNLTPIATDNWGDVNLDGDINTRDLGHVRQMYLKVAEFPTDYIARADVDLNGIIDIRDYNLISDYIMDAKNELTLPLKYQYGDVNRDGKIDELDVDLIVNSYDSLTTEQLTLAGLGYKYEKSQAVKILRDFLDKKINNIDCEYLWITLDLNGYEGDESIETYFYIQKGQVVNLPVLSRIGYTFNGWWTSTNGVISSEDKEITDTSELDANVVLIANWIEE
ncbi:MAG: dockerin type I domain-containing protein [Christensenellales bacterium]